MANNFRARLAQCLCPQRHAILALAIGLSQDELPDDAALEGFQAIIDALIAGEKIDLDLPVTQLPAWCGICGAAASTWHLEIAWTLPHDNWEAAQAAIQKNQADQLASRDLMDALGLTFDAKTPRKPQ